MNSENQIVFYSSKPRVIHMGINIAVAPILLYLTGFWPWPPALPHYIAFAITGLIAMRYIKQRLGRARLTVDEKGLYVDEFYPSESIRNVLPVMRALKLTLIQDGEVREKVIRLGWASNADFNKIVQLMNERYGQPDPS